jgi:hypothetical protein
MEEIHTGVHHARGQRVAVQAQVLLGEVPAAGPDVDRRQPLPQAVLAAVRVGEVDPPVQRVEDVELALDDRAPARSRRVLEVRHPSLGAAVEGVDRHLPRGRARDLDPAVPQVLGRGRNRPAPVVADHGRVGTEAERLLAGAEAATALAPRPQQVAPGLGHGVLKGAQEPQRLRCDDLLVTRPERTVDGDAAVEAQHQNCSFSVEPARARVSLRGFSADATWSKYPAPTSAWCRTAVYPCEASPNSRSCSSTYAGMPRRA